MRVKETKYNKMKSAMTAVVDHYGGPTTVNKQFIGRTLMFMLWNIWTIAERNIRNNDSHPFFIDGYWKRIIPCEEGFDLYSDGDNDSHIATALRSIGNELGLEV